MEVSQGTPPPLDIVYVGTLPPHPGGSAISCAELIARFANLGHAVRCLAPITPEGLEPEDRFAVGHPELEVTRFVVPLFDTGLPIPTPPSYRELERVQIQDKLSRLVASRRPDIILIGRESFAWDVPALARDFSIPSVMTVRGGARTAKLLSGDYPNALGLIEEYRKVSQIVAVAEHLTEGLRRLGLDNVRTISNAIDLSRFRPRPKERALLQELCIDDEDVVVMHVANLQARKRSMDLVRSAEMALREDPRLLYVVVGDGPLKQTMMDSCRELGVFERVRFTGWIEYHRVPDYVNVADLIVVPSESEGLARIYLETQACARVLLASDIPPAREVIVDGETGLLFERGSIGELAAKTLLAAREPELRARIGANALERIRGHSIEQAVAAYVSIIRQVTHSAAPALEHE